MKKIYNRVKKHTIGRVSKSDIPKTLKNLIKILENEISRGNFNIKEQTPTGYQEGFVYYRKRNYFVIYNPKNDKIIKYFSEKGYRKYVKLI